MPYSSSGWLLNFELTGSNSYRFTAGTNQITGNLGGDGAITQLVVTNNNAGPDTPYNLYLGDMTYVEIQPTMVTQIESPVVLYNPMTQGIPDSWWNQYFGTTSGVSASVDSDGDGFSNAEEYALGTDPKSSASTFKVGEMTRNGNSLTIMWASVPGKIYQVQTVAELTSGVWQNAGSTVTAVIEGSRPLLVEVQALVAPSSLANPRRMSNGVDKDRIALVLAVLEKRVGLSLATQDVFVNVAGGVEVNEPAIDLAVALAVASSLMDVAVDPNAVFLGEIGLSGEVRGAPQIEKRLREAARLGFTSALVARRNAGKETKSIGLRIAGVDSLREAVQQAILTRK